MRPLSERLEEIATHYDGDCCDSCDAKIISSIREGARLAKRYEDAPVAKAAYYYRPTMGAATGIMFEGPDFTPLAGQRVRIVLDKEG